MQAYIDPIFPGIGGERLAVKPVAVREDDTVDLKGDGWSLGCFAGALYNEDGSEIARDDLRDALIAEEGRELYETLRISGALDGLLAAQALFSRLLSAMEENPLLRGVLESMRKDG